MWCRWCHSYPVSNTHACRGLVEAKKTDQAISDTMEQRVQVRWLALVEMDSAVREIARRDEAFRRLDRVLRHGSQ